MDTQNVKKEILSRLEAGKPTLHPLPEVPDFPSQGDPMDNFITKLLGFDGQAIEFRTRNDALAWLKSLSELTVNGKKIYSSAAGFEGNVTEEDISELKNAAQINVCVTEGELGVGEMGAIWVTNKSLGHAACALLARELYILLDGASIVGGMQKAYERISLGAEQYGSFFTGPSATADIEAVHITGAQGPLALTAVLYNRPNAPDKPQLKARPDADTSIWAKAILDNSMDNS